MSSPRTSGIVSSAEPAHTSTMARLSVSDIVSSSTGGFVWSAAASCGKYRRITVGRLNTFAGSVTFSSSCRRAVPNRAPCAATLAPKRLPFPRGGGGRTRCGEGPCLVDAAKFLRKALRPSAGNGCVIVDEYVGAVIDGCALKDGLDQYEGFAVLVARGIGDLII